MRLYANLAVNNPARFVTVRPPAWSWVYVLQAVALEGAILLSWSCAATALLVVLV